MLEKKGVFIYIGILCIALAAVLLYALKDGDTPTVQKISAIVSATDEAALSQSDKEYLAAMKNLIVQNATT